MALLVSIGVASLIAGQTPSQLGWKTEILREAVKDGNNLSSFTSLRPPQSLSRREKKPYVPTQWVHGRCMDLGQGYHIIFGITSSSPVHIDQLVSSTGWMGMGLGPDITSYPPPPPPCLTGAQCLDGSPAGYHIQPKSNEAWTIHLQGGGWCTSEESCATRAETPLGASVVAVVVVAMGRDSIGWMCCGGCRGGDGGCRWWW
jgi:hypothetical protein